MKTEEKVKWHQCKRDLGITVIILLLFGIAILHFDIYENFRKNVWVALKARTGIYPNFVVNLFFEWGMWLPTLAVLIESIFVCLKHYWSWLIITLVGVSFFLTINHSNTLARSIQMIDTLRWAFTDLHSFISLIEGIIMFLVLSSPYAAIVSGIVFASRKGYGKNHEV